VLRPHYESSRVVAQKMTTAVSSFTNLLLDFVISFVAVYGVQYLLTQFGAITFKIVPKHDLGAVCDTRKSWQMTIAPLCSTVPGGFSSLKKMLH
jgi:hypothetical protein